MYEFKKITPLNGFDLNDLNNARQNNYAWSMCELDDYIYVGTGKNIPYSTIKKFAPNAQIPFLIKPNNPLNHSAEIWRYKKDGSQKWERVFQAKQNSKLTGFRFMMQDNPPNSAPCIYAAAVGEKTSMQILKSSNGINWFFVQMYELPGSSTNSMLRHGNYLYVAPIDEFSTTSFPPLYRSQNPEFYDWEPVINPFALYFDSSCNPHSQITAMSEFHDKIYVATVNSDGVQIWRTNSEEPEMNHWTLVADKGFGDSLNKYTFSMEEFNGYLYVNAAKELPFAWAVPLGCDVLRIDQKDRWELVVGGRPLLPSTPSTGTRKESLSGLGSGFNNPFNVYAWQMKEFNKQLIVSTFDDSSNMELLLAILLANKTAIENAIGPHNTKMILSIYEKIIAVLHQFEYSIGFDFYVSDDGVHFKWVTLRGLCNPSNYGGRTLYIDTFNDLYLGTANPFQGCEVFKTDGNTHFDGCPVEKLHYEYLADIEEMLEVHWDILSKNLPVIFDHVTLFHSMN
ncbi:hypothetical protein [Sinanaerobacter sp. ZZT-01]|uniref:hypothetical protein n=1 Tax=Sinanaerobacter sp. ZZT-01 TaxID=3111540 RepID=UPI002D790319|nr:hypothetical protein [Sinanaerobacter sp. ZZT-01]WRR93105.1 hypothetical protein U5921_13865 [Sinanaerobacter sp. ZZT-01]